MSCRSGVAGCFLVCSAFALSAADPPWFGQPQFFNIGDNYWNPTETLLRVPFTGQEWGIGFPNGGTDDVFKAEIAHWHRPYFSVISTSTIFDGNLSGISTTGAPPASWDSFRMRTLDGDYLNFGNPNARGFGEGAPQYSLSSPVYQAALIAWAKHAVDIGADGVMMDGISTPLASMIYLPPHAAGSFDSATMRAFRSYLQKNYSAGILQSQFGIADVSAFDFGDFIHSKGLADTWNHTPLTGLSLEFFRFNRQEASDVFRTMIAATKQYAQQTYHRDFLFSCNAAFDPIDDWVRDLMDLTTQESSYIRGQAAADHPFMAPNIRAWKGWKAPVLLAPEAYSPAVSVSDPLMKATVNLERVIIADIQASGGMPSMQAQMNGGVGFPEPIDLSVVSRYVNFILNNPELMSQTFTPAKIALLESAASQINTIFASAPPNNAGASQSMYMGIARILLDSGLSYDSVFLPDPFYSTLSSPSAADLARYPVVIAPLIWTLDDTQANSLLTYAQQGGTLVIVGALGTHLPNGQPANRPQWQAIFSKPGQTSFGAGTIVVATENFGLEYEQTGASLELWQNVNKNLQRKARTAFQALLSPFVQPDVQVSGVTAVAHEPGVTPFFYHDRAGRALVHLVNYDYDETTDQFYTKTKVGLSVRVGSQPVDEVVLRSPDIDGVQSLPFTRNGDTITLTVPVVDAWDVLLFQQNAFAPVIDSASPSSNLGAVGGDSLSFKVQGSDPDGNPLSYSWSVNGQVVAGAFGSSYTFQLPATGGTYVVTVSITDGSRVTRTSWTINASAYRTPRVLFDESHGEQDTIDSAAANILNPQHPNWVLFGNLTAAMQPNYSVSRLTTGPITSQTLSGADVLVIAVPKNPLTAAEIQTVTNFVQAGGGLVFLGGAFQDTSINALTSAWGIQFVNARIESPQNPGSPAAFNVNTFATHPAVGMTPSFFENNGASLTVSPPALALATTSAAEWRSLSALPTQQPGDTNGPFAILAGAEVGKGRVFMSGTDAFTDVITRCACNAGNVNIFLAALSWLTAAVNSASAPSTTTPHISSVLSVAGGLSAMAANSWVEIKGVNLASSTRLWRDSDFSDGQMPTQLDGVRVTFNGKPAFVEYVSSTQVNVLTPIDTAQGNIQIQLSNPAGATTSTYAPMQVSAPGFFVFNGGPYVAATHADASYVGPQALYQGYSSPAKPGETVVLYASGFGQTVPLVTNGSATQSGNLSPLPDVTVGGAQATVQFAGTILPGLYQLNVVIPKSTPDGDIALRAGYGGFFSQSGVLISVEH